MTALATQHSPLGQEQLARGPVAVGGAEGSHEPQSCSLCRAVGRAGAYLHSRLRAMQPRVVSSRAPEMVSTATNQAGGCHTATVCVTTSGSFCSVCGGSGVRAHGGFSGPWSTAWSAGSAHRALGGGAGWHRGAPGGDIHHQCHCAAAAAAT